VHNTVDRYRLLDLFCGEGGAAMGYLRAGFDVTGVDRAPMPRYPYHFVQEDALAYLARHWQDFDAVHCSPPCQAYTMLRNQHGNEHPELIPATRAAIAATGLPYVMENVIGAPLQAPVMLCGEMFGLRVLRHRLFETNWALDQPAHPKHRGAVRGWRHGGYRDGPYVAVYGSGGGKASHAEGSAAMGIYWMSADGVREAIPPAYTEHIGRYLIAELGGRGGRRGTPPGESAGTPSK
jgi:hypothetical protein